MMLSDQNGQPSTEVSDYMEERVSFNEPLTNPKLLKNRRET